MNPWNQFLEGLHSAIIDELVELHPKPKPELGMPTRGSSLVAPTQGLDSWAYAVIELNQVKGLAIVGMDAQSALQLNQSALDLLTSTLRRALPEFKRRGILPVIHPLVVEPADDIGKAFKAMLKKVIWFPFKLGSGRCYLGIAVS